MTTETLVDAETFARRIIQAVEAKAPHMGHIVRMIQDRDAAVGASRDEPRLMHDEVKQALGWDEDTTDTRTWHMAVNAVWTHRVIVESLPNVVVRAPDIADRGAEGEASTAGASRTACTICGQEGVMAKHYDGVREWRCLEHIGATGASSSAAALPTEEANDG